MTFQCPSRAKGVHWSRNPIDLFPYLKFCVRVHVKENSCCYKSLKVKSLEVVLGALVTRSVVRHVYLLFLFPITF
jgi:hypothetical protein